jgi:serine/threonine protein kinase
MEVPPAIIVSMAKAAYEACRAAQRYQNEAARIGMLLQWILARAEKWEALVGSPGDDTFDLFHDALHKIYICMDRSCTGGNATKNRRCWYQRYTVLFSSQDMLANILSAENELNTVINVLKLDLVFELISSSKNGSELQCRESVADRLTSFGNTKSDINSIKTIAQEMNQTLKVCHEMAPRTTVSPVEVLAFEQDEEVGHGNVNEQGHQVAFHHPTAEDLKNITVCPTQVAYNEEDILGIGGFADVFRGTYHDKNGETRVVAVKRLKVDSVDLRCLSDQERAHDAKQLATEAWLAYQCGVYKHVVEIIGCQTSFNSRDRPFIVMELLRTNLFDALHHYKDLRLLETPLSYARRFHLMKGIAGALEFLHLRGVVHHDNKSANILLDEDMMVAKLSDFGEAKIKELLYTTKLRQHTTISPTSRQAVAVAGTAAYLAPEILTEDVTEISRVCDMYSFGVTVWECLTGEIPHKGKAEFKVANLASKKNHEPMLHVPSKPPSIGLSKEEINAWEALKTVALPCLSRDRKIRPTASQVVAIWNYTRPLDVLEEDLPVAGVAMNIASVPTTPVHEDDTQVSQLAQELQGVRKENELRRRRNIIISLVLLFFVVVIVVASVIIVSGPEPAPTPTHSAAPASTPAPTPGGVDQTFYRQQ